ncbi:MAG: hypothetical protein ABR926_20970 [Streptosporangiaceae bacterium]|jgi:hypothetical protein
MASRPGRLMAAAAREVCGAAVLTAVTCALASCSASSPPRGHASPPGSSPSGAFTPAALTPGGRPAWMLTRTALTQVASEPAVLAGLQRSRVLEILPTGQKPLAVAGAQPVVTFSSISELDQAVSGGQLPAGTRAVLYDPEVWAFTPRGEQLDPAGAAGRARDIAHAHRLALIVAPALNLTTVRADPAGGPRWRQFLRLGLAGAIAKVSDVLELQAQSLERDPSTYATFVRDAAAQARAANPRVAILAGLSTNPPGAEVTSQQLTAAIHATRGIADGYWLNIPGRGPRCPTCNSPRPDVGRVALRAVL